MKKSNKQSMKKSFQHAFTGILNTLIHERNMQVHICIMILVILFGVLLSITVVEWCLCLFLFTIVLSLELVNTSIETTIDLVMPDIHPLAKKAKDAAAGAVLISAFIATIIGCIIFVPKLFDFMQNLT